MSVNNITVIATPLEASNVGTGWPGNSVTLLESLDSSLFTLDSSTPYLWLPESVCNQFEKHLGLVYDQNIDLYTFGNKSSQQETLAKQNLTFDFTISDLPDSANTVSLTLPYAAFDLQLSYPFPHLNATESSDPVKYFPLRKASNDSQYTLGRAFLQETYLLVDYERNNFSVFQAKFPANTLVQTHIIDISRPGNSTFKGPDEARPSRWNGKLITGTAVGSSAALLVLTGFVVVCCRRQGFFKRSSTGGIGKGKDSAQRRFAWNFWWLRSTLKEKPAFEVDGSESYAKEFPTCHEIKELPTCETKELQGTAFHAYSDQSKRTTLMTYPVTPSDHDPSKPVELESYSPSKGKHQENTVVELRSSTPPYSPDYIRQLSSQSPSISAQSNDESQRSTRVISPITPKHADKVSPISRLGQGPQRSSSREGN